ncbi:MAG: toprim domain-containing protein [Hyphomicrobiales bacterium]|nr:toprim domain-containing protein [Hyphomicrobiales bacterium]MDE2116167.1 toprim domain-containing protein [Hyphomicrobiales bacterium]
MVAGLASRVEEVCKLYLSNGYREGSYWRCGDARNTSGQSLYVRLRGPAAKIGRWTDAATGEYGDLLNLIGESLGLTNFADIAVEARNFLRLPALSSSADVASSRLPKSRSPETATLAAKRLFGMAIPIHGTLVTRYFASRGLVLDEPLPALRFHPKCFYRDDPHEPSQNWPALLGAVTDVQGNICGVHRTWLNPSGHGKAPVTTPRKHLGLIVGHALRFGEAGSVMMAGEGIETTLSLRMILATMPMMAAGSGGHLGALQFPSALRRLYILRDRDAAGAAAVVRLQERASEVGIEALALTPQGGDFNDDLCKSGVEALRLRLSHLLIDADRARFLER